MIKLVLIVALLAAVYPVIGYTVLALAVAAVGAGAVMLARKVAREGGRCIPCPARPAPAA